LKSSPFFIILQSSIESDLSPLLKSSSLNPMQAAKMTSCLAGFPAVTDQLRSVLEAGIDLAISLFNVFRVIFQNNFTLTSS
jgi:hypothetical protein